jgi:glycosyltransferase involved in cell wall biosynthesis
LDRSDVSDHHIPAVPARPASSPAARPSLSVIICSYSGDRWDQLTAAVESAQRQVQPGDEVILVIDHNEVLQAQASRDLAGVRVLSNAYAQGASGGRNTGAEIATGEILVFLDDDAQAEPGWLDRQLGWYDDSSVVAVGGAADPNWEGGQRPDWLPPTFDWVVGCSYAGQPLTATQVRNVWACNMSVRRSAFHQVGGFATSIGGVQASVTLGCEETELCIRLAGLGVVMYEPASRVRHFVPRGRQTKGYLLRRCRTEGRSKFMVAQSVGRAAATSVERGYVASVVLGTLRQADGGPKIRLPVRAMQALLAFGGLAFASFGYFSSWLSAVVERSTRAVAR